ncbi:hypothetical protein Cni_G10089 [Canna indica]|uniref:RNase H type-1 domain-containing protein n=1 Tax=Canna indica TaxID=4628 RepID=A0AAQ3K605_9LILI|nr:hypothetical protein Cni_G10089 [Canna indica]
MLDVESGAPRKKDAINIVPPLTNAPFNLFCDAAWRSKDVAAGARFVILNKDRMLVAKARCSTKAHSPLVAEVWAIWHDLVMAENLNIVHMNVFTDCLPVVNIPRKKDKPLWFLLNIISDIWDIGESLQVVE